MCCKYRMKKIYQIVYLVFLALLVITLFVFGEWRMLGISVAVLMLLLSPIVSVSYSVLNIYSAAKGKMEYIDSFVLTGLHVCYLVFFTMYLFPAFMVG